MFTCVVSVCVCVCVCVFVCIDMFACALADLALTPRHRRYATTSDGTFVSDFTCLIQNFYGEECARPLHLVVDTSLVDSKISVKAFVTDPNAMVERCARARCVCVCMCMCACVRVCVCEYPCVRVFNVRARTRCQHVCLKHVYLHGGILRRRREELTCRGAASWRSSTR